MSTGNELDINTLSWVKSEIDETLDQARSALEAYVEDQDDESRLQFCLNYIHQIRGTLQMVELYGASMAAEEMEALVQALIDNQVSNREDAYEVLVRGIMQLPDYLEHLLVGHQDLPMVLLPLLNDLRAARGDALLSENALFSPNLDVEAPNGSDLTTNISELAQKLRHNYHLGLLGWFRDQDSDASLKRISDVISRLREVSGEIEVNRLLWVASGLVESLRQGGLDSSISIKLLLGQLDRQIKRIIDNGMIALQNEPPHELLKNLLYYVATSQSTDDRTLEVRKAFQLDQALPDTHTLEKARADLSAPNAALMGTVSSVLMEDLVRVKDSLDVFVRKEDRELSELTALADNLNSMADTLGMMGLGVQRHLVIEQVEKLRDMVTGEVPVEDSGLMGVASALLSLESSLKESSVARAANEVQEGVEADATAEEKLQEAERHQLLKTVIDQANADLVQVKEALNDMSRYPGRVSVLARIPDTLDTIRGSLAMLDLERAANLLENCANYVRTNVLEPQQVPEADSLDYLADAISSIEYYLESLVGKWAHPESILRVAEKSLEKLAELSVGASAPGLEQEQNDSTQPDLVMPEEFREDGSSADTVIDLNQLDDTTEDNLSMPEIQLEEEDTQNEISLSNIDLSSIELSQPDLSEITESEEETLNDISIVDINTASGALEAEKESESQTNISLSEIDLSSLELDMPSSTSLSQPDLAEFEITVDGTDTLEEAEAGQSQLTTLNDIEEPAFDRSASETVSDDIADEDTMALEVEWPEENIEASSQSQAGLASSESSTYEVPEEIDDEILEIFMEEAEEQYDVINELLPRWEADHNDEEALTDMRRSFHTLKGSGRLVGANDVGEFAWAFENLLNRVIDKTIEPVPVLFQLLQLAKDSLPHLFELFKIRQKPEQEIFTLMQYADDLREGREVVLQKPAAQEAPVEEAVDEAEQFVEEDVSVAEDKTEPSPLEGIDPVLLDIFRKEVATHIENLRNYSRNWKPGLAESENEPVMRALHTLKGSSRTTGVTVMADACSEFELYIKDLKQVHYPIGAPAIPLLDELANYIESIISELDRPGAILQGNQDLISRIKDLRATIPVTEPSVASTSSLMEAQIEAHINETLNSSDESSPSLVEITATDIEMPEYDDELLEIFIEEGEEILEESDNTLSQWIETPEDNALLEAMQRQLHTLKGGARMAGVVEIGDLGHATESLLTAVVEGQQSVSKKMFNVLQQVQDELVQLLENVKLRKEIQNPLGLIQEVENLLGKKSTEAIQDAAEETELITPDISLGEVQQEVPEAEELDLSGNRQPIPDEIHLPESEVVQEESDEPDTMILETPDSFDLSAQSAENLDDSFMQDTQHEVEKDEAFPAAELSGENAEINIDLEEIELSTSVEPVDVVPADNVVELPQRKDSSLPASEELIEVETAPEEETLPQPAAKQPATSAPQQTPQIRVRADLLNDLVNFAGEVSIYRSRMEQQSNSFRYNLRELDETVSRLRQQLRQFEIETETQIEFRKEDSLSKEHDDFDPLEFDRFTYMQQLSRGMLESLNDLDSLREILSNITRESETLLIQQARVNTELQEGLMRTRMVPFSGQATRLRRIVRQTSNELNKDIELHLHGMDGEIDRQVLDRILPAIEHMLRNSVAHGIEPAEVRGAAGKPATARIDLTFAREGSDIIIRIEDDGAGFNIAAIRNKAIEKGLIQASDDVPRETLLNLVMESGFSTADKVTQISGRGVGMDVVNNEIKQLGGLIKIDTEEGKGTGITINLPLTLAIARALMINVGDDVYATPLLGVQAVERISQSELRDILSVENPVYHWLDEEYPVMNLSSMLGLPETGKQDDNAKIPLLLVRSGDYRAAIEVDGLIGSREVVVKPVGPQLSTLRGISGATIMGDGQVVLILDLGVLLRLQDTLFTVTAETASELEEVEEVEEVAQRVPLVMVVDDSITVRKVTTRLLERQNYDVITAKDGVDALTQLQDIHPDVMLLDVEMPRMDGYELATNVRNDEKLKDIPIIMITSRTADKHKQRAFDIGVNEYMGKPFHEADLLNNIKQFLNS